MGNPVFDRRFYQYNEDDIFNRLQAFFFLQAYKEKLFLLIALFVSMFLCIHTVEKLEMNQN